MRSSKLQAQSWWQTLDRHQLVVWGVSQDVNPQTHPANTEEDGGGISQLVSKCKIEPTKDAMQHNPSQCQRCRDFAWRRLVVRRSATRRPTMFQYRFYIRVAISKIIVYTDAVGRYEWFQVVKGIQTQPDVKCDGNNCLCKI